MKTKRKFVSANLYFTHRIDVQLSGIQSSVLLAIGLQHKSMELVATELELPVSNILALFCKIVKKFSVVMNSVVSGRLRISLEKSQRDVQPKVNEMKPTEVSLEQDLEEAANEIMTEQRQEKKLLNAERVNKYDITGSCHFSTNVSFEDCIGCATFWLQNMESINR